MKLRYTCREAANLIVARQDRDLGLTERVVLRLHLLACDACPRFARQIDFMRVAMRSWSDPNDHP